MKIVENGNTVSIHYKGTFPNGEVFDDSRIRETTMNTVVGSGALIPSFENALLGMQEGQVKKINLTAAEAFGEYVDSAVVTVPRTAFPPDMQLNEGQMVTANGPQGQQMHAKIVSFTDNDVTIDHNHPLAGKDVNFEIEVVEISSNVDDDTTSDE
tara:strand:+ start:1108 stop:1572 length:465 start_codon:yes stop_codon:yes gene_type:complete